MAGSLALKDVWTIIDGLKQHNRISELDEPEQSVANDSVVEFEFSKLNERPKCKYLHRTEFKHTNA